jgi:hypothetical protein
VCWWGRWMWRHYRRSLQRDAPRNLVVDHGGEEGERTERACDRWRRLPPTASEKNRTCRRKKRVDQKYEGEKKKMTAGGWKGGESHHFSGQREPHQRRAARSLLVLDRRLASPHVELQEGYRVGREGRGGVGEKSVSLFLAVFRVTGHSLGTLRQSEPSTSALSRENPRSCDPPGQPSHRDASRVFPRGTHRSRLVLCRRPAACRRLCDESRSVFF